MKIINTSEFAASCEASNTNSVTCLNLAVDIELDIATADYTSSSDAPPIPAQLQDTMVVMDPSKIRVTGIPNRLSGAFADEDFEALVTSIRASGGNTVPVEVRTAPLHADGTEFELIFGERRVRACIAAGTMVRTIVVCASKAINLSRDILLENALRKNLSPIELGRQVKQLLSTNPELTSAAIAADLGMSKSMISEAVRLASLPEELLVAVPALSDLQFRHAKVLTDAVDADWPRLQNRVQEIRANGKMLSTKEFVRRLLQSDGIQVQPSNSPKVGTPLKHEGNVFGYLSVNKNGTVEITFASPVKPEVHKRLARSVENLYRRAITKNVDAKTSTQDDVT